MGYKDKMAEGVDATGRFTFAQVNDAVAKIVKAMGEKTIRIHSADESDGTIWLYLFKSGAQKFMNFSVVDAITKDPDMSARVTVRALPSGKTEVAARINEAKTTQQVVLGFIPAAPKSVHGITTYRDFCGHLTRELRRIDRSATVAQRGQ